MTLSKLMLCCGLVYGVASAASSYRVTLLQPSMLGDTELKPGDYRIDVDGDKAVIKAGKNTVETAPVKVETGDQKFGSTVVRYTKGDGRYHIQEIHIGGTKTKLVFNN